MLVRELGLSELTAGVLVRRGYANPDAARTFLAAVPPGHDPFLLGDMAKAVETIRAAIAAGKRICVHGDYDVDGICATALALLCLRSLGADAEWHLPSRFDEGYGLSGETLDRLAADGLRTRLDGRLRDHGSGGDRSREGARTGRRRHRPPPAGSAAARLSRGGDAAVRVSVPGAVRDRSRGEARRGARGARRGARGSDRPGDDRRRRSARRRESRVRPRGSARAREDAEARSARAHGDRARRSGGRRRGVCRVPARAAHQRGRTARPSARGARPAPDGRRRRGATPCRPPRGGEPRTAGRRGAHRPRGRRADRGVAGESAPSSRVRRCRRRLARGRDRDRRVAARRALPPPGRPHRRERGAVEGLGPVDERVRPARRARRVLRPPRPLGRASRRRRACRSIPTRSSRLPQRSPTTPTPS